MQRKMLDPLLGFYLSGDIRGGAAKTDIIAIFDNGFGINSANTFIAFGRDICALQLIAGIRQMRILQPGSQWDNVAM